MCTQIMVIIEMSIKNHDNSNTIIKLCAQIKSFHIYLLINSILKYTSWIGNKVNVEHVMKLRIVDWDVTTTL